MVLAALLGDAKLDLSPVQVTKQVVALLALGGKLAEALLDQRRPTHFARAASIWETRNGSIGKDDDLVLVHLQVAHR